jgi:hypothetical protein
LDLYSLDILQFVMMFMDAAHVNFATEYYRHHDLVLCIGESEGVILWTVLAHL